MRAEQSDDLLTWMILGVILGGRLGYVLFYQPAFFAANPARDPRGLARRHVLPRRLSRRGRRRRRLLASGTASRSSASATPSPPRRRSASSSGGIANFINAELWGRPSTAPWAVVFPGEAAQACPPDWTGPCARHPSQLYEAGARGRCSSSSSSRWPSAPARSPGRGRVFGLFLIGYALARIVVEIFRQADAQFVTPDNPHGHVLALGAWGLTMGQLLSLPMLAVGLVLVLRSGPPRRDPFAADLRAPHRRQGPLRLDAYMAALPRAGYYATRDPLGAAGDFTTAPEISQMFGELVGLWLAQAWADQGGPRPSSSPSSAPAAAR